MTINLTKILDDAGWTIERKNDVAVFYNRAPWLGDQAYVHIVYAPATTEALQEVDAAIVIPDYWQEFLGAQNGAWLFGGDVNIFGVEKTGTLINRSDPFRLGPLSIVRENLRVPKEELKTKLILGGCDNGRSFAVLDRASGRVSAVPRESGAMSTQWASPGDWILGEIERLGEQFKIPPEYKSPLD